MKKTLLVLVIASVLFSVVSCEKKTTGITTQVVSPVETVSTETAAVEHSEAVAETKLEDVEETVSEPSESSVVSLTGEFRVLDAEEYNGTRFTAELFTDCDVTMVNVFTTWCTWCIKELPDMVKLAKDMPEGSKLIAVCADAFDNAADLKTIMEQYGVDFPVLKMTESQVKEIGTIIGYPTTFYVGRNAEILDMSIGMPSNGVEGYRTKVEQLLKKYGTSK